MATQGRKQFEQICVLWKRLDAMPFVPRQTLHDLLWRDIDAHSETPGTMELAHVGTDISLDAFAKSGANYEMYEAVQTNTDEPENYFRYRVTRNGVVGYARRDALTFSEREAISAALRRAGEKAEREADALHRETARRNRKLTAM